MLAAGFGRKFNQNADSQEYERATEEELLAAVKVCVELGLDVNAVNAQGDSAMHVAAGESIVRFLAQHGAKLDVKNKQGRTPLDVAILRKDGSGRQLLPAHSPHSRTWARRRPSPPARVRRWSSRPPTRLKKSGKDASQNVRHPGHRMSADICVGGCSLEHGQCEKNRF